MDAEFSHGDPATTVATLQAFAAFVRRGGVGRGKQVGTQAVQVALRSVGAKFELDAQPNPCYKDGFTPKYWRALEQQIECYRRQDPVPEPKLAVPVAVPHWCVASGLASKSPKAQAIGDLTNVAFYYLLRVGEYTYLPPTRKRRTQQFRVRDVKFWKNGQVLSLDSPDRLSADAGTLTLTNQKKTAPEGPSSTTMPPILSHVPSRPSPAASPTSSRIRPTSTHRFRPTTIVANSNMSSPRTSTPPS